MKTATDTIHTSRPSFSITPLPTELAEKVRRSLRDDFGNQLSVQIDHDGGSPCRHCLKLTSPGDALLLFTYKPFAQPCLYQEIGPVFVHASDCARYDEAKFPADFLTRPLLLRPYNERDEICGSQVLVSAGEAEATLLRLFDDAGTAYVHARSVSRGCFLFRIDRLQFDD